MGQRNSGRTWRKSLVNIKKQQLEQLCREWNERHPYHSKVEYEGAETLTRSHAWVMNGNAVILVNGRDGAVSLDDVIAK